MLCAVNIAYLLPTSAVLMEFALPRMLSVVTMGVVHLVLLAVERSAVAIMEGVARMTRETALAVTPVHINLPSTKMY